jgi:TRAP-type C4-dicarboxylate transport system substrate-binding protein
LGWEAKTIEALGATTVFMSATEGTTSQKTGVIDGSTQTYYGMPGWGLVDITKEVVELGGHTHTLVIVGANLKKWGSWSEEVKQILLQASRKVESDWVACQQSADQQVIEQFNKMNVPIYKLTAAELEKAKELTKPVFDTWIKAVGEDGRKVIEDYQNLK